MPDEPVNFGEMTVEQRLAWLDKPTPKPEVPNTEFKSLPGKRSVRIPDKPGSAFPWSHAEDGYSYLELPNHSAFATLRVVKGQATLAFFDWDNPDKYPETPEVFRCIDYAKDAMRKAELWYTAEVNAFNAKIEERRRHRQNRI